MELLEIVFIDMRIDRIQKKCKEKKNNSVTYCLHEMIDRVESMLLLDHISDLIRGGVNSLVAWSHATGEWIGSRSIPPEICILDNVLVYEKIINLLHCPKI